MSNKKITMLKLKRILQLLAAGVSQREISNKVGISRSSIAAYKDRADLSGKSYQDLLLLSDSDVASLLQRTDYRPGKDARYNVLEPLLQEYSGDITQNRSTYECLWVEYLKLNPEGYGYTRFKAYIQDYIKSHHYSYHNVYAPGFEMQVDFAGDKLKLIDRKTGLITEVVVLCCILPYSSIAFIIALYDATQESFYYGLSRALSYFRGVPESVKSDNMRQWVTRTDRYEPTFNESTMQWSVHYDTELVATRPARPKDKAHVEGLVYKTYQFVYSRIRNEEHQELHMLNARMFELIEEFNSRNMSGRTYSRMELFEREEMPLLKPLPAEPFILKHKKEFRVPSNYHVQIGKEKHSYSIPYQYVNQKATVVFDMEGVEVYVAYNRVAIHKRDLKANGYTTEPSHMPENHRAYQKSKEYNAAYYIGQARHIGPHTTTVIERILASQPFIQQAYRSSQGILSLAKKYPVERLEAACKRACTTTSAVSYTAIKRILELKLDTEQINPDTSHIPFHENLRGSSSFE